MNNVRVSVVPQTSGQIMMCTRVVVVMFLKCWSQVPVGFLQKAQTWANAEFVSPLQVTHLPPVWDLLLPLA